MASAWFPPAQMPMLTNRLLAYCPGPVDTPVSVANSILESSTDTLRKMWEVLDEAIGKKQGLSKGVAFEKSVEARSAFKRASVRSPFTPKVYGIRNAYFLNLADAGRCGGACQLLSRPWFTKHYRTKSSG